MDLNSVRQAYKAVNLSGHINDTLLHPDAYEHLELPFTPRQPSQQSRSLPNRVVDAFCDATQHAAYNARFVGSVVRSVRSNPEVQIFCEWSPLIQSGCPALLATYYPVANILIGRGHTPALFLPPETMQDTQSDLYEKYNTHTHHGLAGYVFEAFPVWCADKLEGYDQHAAATACMLAAVVNRSMLQVSRLAMSAQVLVIECAMVAPFVGVIFFCEMSVRAALGMCALLQRRTDGPPDSILSAFAILRQYGPISERDTTIDDGSPGVDQRIRDRLAVLNMRLRPLFASESTTPAQIDKVVSGMADDLRRYCSALPSAAPLRGGLALLKATVESLWTTEDGVSFNPPELAQ